MIGLMGAHRTGKTTLARKAAEESPLYFCETSLTKFLQGRGVDPKADMGIIDRITLQSDMLEYLNERYVEAHTESTGTIITDRTPLDVLAYTLADVNRGNCSDTVDRLIAEHTQHALELTRFWFGAVILVQPGIPLVDADGKAQASTAYIEHLNLIMRGLLASPSVKGLPCETACIAREIIDLNDRTKIVSHYVNRQYSTTAVHTRTMH